MKIEALGHVVLKVSDLEESEQFYNGLLGLPVCARLDEQGYKMTFFSLGDHHDLAIAEVAADEPAGGPRAVGLHHVAFRIGNSIDALREARDQLVEAGLSPSPVDHEVTKSLYFEDPDGNRVELYVDVSDAWRTEPQRIAQVMPLEL
jgi:catechol 2,3-dioxygenase